MSKCSRARRRFRNAREVLPPDVLAAVQQVIGSKSMGLWVPGTRADAVRARAKRIVALHRAGTPTRAIAEQEGVTVRRVQQIIAANRGES